MQRRLVAAEDRVEDPRGRVDFVEGRLEGVAPGVLDGAAGRLLVVDPARVDGRHEHVRFRPREVGVIMRRALAMFLCDDHVAVDASPKM